MAADGQVGVDPLLKRGEPKVVEPTDLTLGERQVREILQWRPSEQGEPAAEGICCRPGVPGRKGVSPPIHQGFQPMEIQLAVLHREQVSGGTRQ